MRRRTWCRRPSRASVSISSSSTGRSRSNGRGSSAYGVVVTEPDCLRDVTRPGYYAFVLLDAQRDDGLSGESGEAIDWECARALVDAGELKVVRARSDKGAGPKENGDRHTRGLPHGANGNAGPSPRTKTEDRAEKEDKVGEAQEAHAHLDTPRRARLPLILAGRLTPWNVAEAIARVYPWAVDVSGVIELEDGSGKDAANVRAFVQVQVTSPATPAAVRTATVVVVATALAQVVPVAATSHGER